MRGFLRTKGALIWQSRVLHLFLVGKRRKFLRLLSRRESLRVRGRRRTRDRANVSFIERKAIEQEYA